MNKPRINVTPLIDVLLVLLIIFLVITPLRPAAFRANIPSEPDPGVAPDPRTIVVSVRPDSSLLINEAATGATVDAPGKLVGRLAAIFAERSAFGETERTVFLKAPPSIGYGRVASVIDALNQSGAFPISLQIDGLDR